MRYFLLAVIGISGFILYLLEKNYTFMFLLAILVIANEIGEIADTLGLMYIREGKNDRLS